MNQMKQLKAAEVVKLALISIGAAAILVLLSGADPLTASKMFFNGIFGSTSGFGEVFVKATPLILTGLGCSVAFRTGFFNIGGEGQFYIGALASAWVAINATAVPGVFRIILAIACGFLLGGLWALAAAILKAKLGISEIICTIMLNYISINLLGIAVRTFLMDPAGSIPQSEKIDASAVLLRFLAPTRVHTGIFIALGAVLFVWFLMEKTAAGYEFRVVGFNKRAAACNGISVVKNIILSAVLSGGLAGTAGAVEVLGVQKKLLEGMSGGCGYTAILITLLASNHPAGVLVVSVLFAALEVGANSMQRQMGVPSSIVDFLIGFIVLLILGRELLAGKMRAREGK
ncbi:ABC transporter permease [Lacrimispora saccharolytica]|uniref:Inner-membrane translocator n=1 Tax=Lacrimispora saccharolytica (strain ATCC 35040 / DSM 2544 / NRCC 2533 / WM1) TaxID=610130 RepID=D9RAF1_LACSW|nr:ABC transporter permease [Lacrimispora saccharolytica]ADL04229.1 inner-membrane translocator [[Clostridium] saccharolyticum WM1]QRV21490.1 ABC transporter permease [Lacrimispora saccharolytica]